MSRVSTNVDHGGSTMNRAASDIGEQMISVNNLTLEYQPAAVALAQFIASGPPNCIGCRGLTITAFRSSTGRRVRLFVALSSPWRSRAYQALGVVVGIPFAHRNRVHSYPKMLGFRTQQDAFFAVQAQTLRIYPFLVVLCSSALSRLLLVDSFNYHDFILLNVTFAAGIPNISKILAGPLMQGMLRNHYGSSHEPIPARNLDGFQATT